MNSPRSRTQQQQHQSDINPTFNSSRQDDAERTYRLGSPTETGLVDCRDTCAYCVTQVHINKVTFGQTRLQVPTFGLLYKPTNVPVQALQKGRLARSINILGQLYDGTGCNTVMRWKGLDRVRCSSDQWGGMGG
ncbi:uncharacterized protein H6S33_009994 [Morchella sextelata]|uniref:uncharacterized protein n=1 Tax=Morchella sextelata TaxID=1174677 RepID=UPI001D04E001|nr:uncharacterized protein H6S33_009994 [Morchella sextelata]KAH0611942.1 hypothetical protein H6S33_009994 [Morchella sextelata]